MEALDALKTRRSIRAFLPKMPARSLIRECLEAASWAPSATNQQPWEFIVLAGDELQKVNEINQEKFAERMQGDPFGEIPDALQERQQEIFTVLMEIAQQCTLDANEFFVRSLRFFDAPVGVYFITYKQPNDQYRLSSAAAIQNFLVAAHDRGLGTCWLTVTVICQADLKVHFGLADNKEIIGGVALGYPDPASPFNTFLRTRVPVDNLTTWRGF